MKAILELERGIRALELPLLGCSVVADHAAVHVLTSDTLAIVLMCGHNARIVEQAVRDAYPDAVSVFVDRDVITVTLESTVSARKPE